MPLDQFKPRRLVSSGTVLLDLDSMLEDTNRRRAKYGHQYEEWQHQFPPVGKWEYYVRMRDGSEAEYYGKIKSVFGKSSGWVHVEIEIMGGNIADPVPNKRSVRTQTGKITVVERRFLRNA